MLNHKIKIKRIMNRVKIITHVNIQIMIIIKIRKKLRKIQRNPLIVKFKSKNLRHIKKKLHHQLKVKKEKKIKSENNLRQLKTKH